MDGRTEGRGPTDRRTESEERGRDERIQVPRGKGRRKGQKKVKKEGKGREEEGRKQTLLCRHALALATPIELTCETKCNNSASGQSMPRKLGRQNARVPLS